MKVHFVTSGFPDGFPDEFIGELKKYLPLQNRLTFVASDFAAHEKAKKYAGMFVRWFAEKGVDFGKLSLWITKCHRKRRRNLSKLRTWSGCRAGRRWRKWNPSGVMA